MACICEVCDFLLARASSVELYIEQVNKYGDIS
jgi:hypothetical protein